MLPDNSVCPVNGFIKFPLYSKEKSVSICFIFLRILGISVLKILSAPVEPEILLSLLNSYCYCLELLIF
jgi:hypothetical protein